MEYAVTWDIDIDAKSPENAAEEALKVHRDPSSIATVFKVADENGKIWTVDLHARAGDRVTEGTKAYIKGTKAYIVNDYILGFLVEEENFFDEINWRNFTEIYLDGFICQQLQSNWTARAGWVGYKPKGLPHSGLALFDGTNHLVLLENGKLVWVCKNINLVDWQTLVTPKLVTLLSPSFVMADFVGEWRDCDSHYGVVDARERAIVEFLEWHVEVKKSSVIGVQPGETYSDLVKEFWAYQNGRNE